MQLELATEAREGHCKSGRFRKTIYLRRQLRKSANIAEVQARTSIIKSSLALGL